VQELVRKFITAFVISLLVFAVSAAVIVGALAIGRDKYSPPADRNEKTELSGESFNLLLIMTDYSPEKFDDYDPDAVKNIFGKDVSSKGDSNALDGYRRIYAEDMTLLRFDKERGQLTYTHIPGNTLVSVGGVKTCLEEIPAFYGTDYLVDKSHAILGVDIDTYVLLTPESAAAKSAYALSPCDHSKSERQAALNALVPAQSPSMPSVRFTAFIIKATHSAVAGTESEPR
jgi:anionic cell wall polymer biosynthesis LytR-Cps2A-Psr (LCP) family protein